MKAKHTLEDLYCAKCAATTRGGCWLCAIHRKAVVLPEVERLALSICRIAGKHEVQYWKNEPGTNAQKLARVLTAAREIVAIAKAEGKDG